MPRGTEAVRGLAAVFVSVIGCAPLPTPEAPPLRRWVPVEAAVDRIEYPAGDGAVSHAERVLILVPAQERFARALPILELPERVGVGEIFRIIVRVPRAGDRERRTFRLRCARPGLRLIDGDLVTTVGRSPAERRAIADSAGPTRFEIDEIPD